MMKKLQKMQQNRKLLLILLALCTLLSGCTQQDAAPVQKSSVAMGTVVSVKLYHANTEAAESLCSQVFAELQRLDTQVLSKNTETAELWRLNQAENPEMPQAVSAELYYALWQTREIYALSDGRAALASGALTELWGMDTEAFRVPSEAEIEAALLLVNDDFVQLSEAAQTVSFRQGQVLNLGSVGKGIACDSAVALLESAGADGGVVTVGGSVGVFGMPKTGSEWKIGIRDPFGDENRYFAVISLKNGFLSTSGSYEKQFTENGRNYHHLLDLSTGYPKETNLCSVTVLAKTGLESDALSTLCFLLGEEKSRPILSEKGASAVFVYQDKTVHIAGDLFDSLEIRDHAYTYKYE